MATASELISNRGDAALGAGSNANISVGANDPNLNLVNKTIENIMLLDAQRNAQIFQQKVRDRDKTLELIDQGQIVTGDLLDKDRPVINKLQEEANKSFDYFVKNGGLKNPQAYQKYQKSIKDLKDATTWAQHRKLGKDQLLKEQSQQELPDQQKAYSEHIKKADESGFWNDYSPYQKTLSADYSYQDVLGQNRMTGGVSQPTATSERVTTTTKGGKPTTTVTQTTTPIKGKGASPVVAAGTITKTTPDGRTLTISEQKYDYDSLKNDVNKKYLEQGKDGVEMNMWLKNIEQNPQPLQSKQMLEYIKQRVDQYNGENNLGDDDPNKLKFQIGQVTVDDKGQILSQTDPNANVLELRDADGNIKGYKINMPTAEFNAMTILAKHPGSYVNKTQQWDQEYDLFKLKQQSEKDANALGWFKAREQQRMNNARIAKMNSDEQKDHALNQIWDNNIQQTKGLKIEMQRDYNAPASEPLNFRSQLEADKSLPIYTLGKNGQPEILKPIDAQPVYDKVDKDGKATSTSKVVGWKGGYYKVNYINPSTNQSIDEKTITDKFYQAKKINPSLSIEEFIKGSIKRGAIDYSLQGDSETGTTNRQISKGAQIIISNKNQKKGQEGAFDEEEQDDGIPKAKDGMTDALGGSNWTLEEDLEGDSHEEGGINIDLNGNEIEAEDKELVLKNERGEKAIIPKRDRSKVMGWLKDKVFDRVSKYVSKLPRNPKVAEEGGIYDDGGGDDNKTISPKNMQDWNDFVAYLKQKGLSGHKDMDHPDFSEKQLKEYIKQNPDTSLSPQIVPLVQRELKNVRQFLIDQDKQRVKEGKKSAFVGDTGKDYENVMPVALKTRDDGIIGQYTSQFVFPKGYEVNESYVNGQLEKKTTKTGFTKEVLKS